MGQTVMKGNARKVRRLGSDNAILAGFAGATADAIACDPETEHAAASSRGRQEGFPCAYLVLQRQ